MKAAVIHAQGGPEVLSYEEIDDPIPGPDDIVIAVEAISLEGGDLLHRSILPLEQFPHVVGYQAGGRIAALGANVSGLEIGQRVAGFSFSGSHAEKFRVPAHYAFPVPDALDMKAAATMPVTFGTAGWALFEAGSLQAGETVFIRGGTGGVGIAAVQLAKAAGARVIATAGSRSCGRMGEFGCDHAIAYDTVDYVDEVARLTDGRGADLVVDLVGGDTAEMARLVSTVAYRGRLAVVGLSSGEAPSISFWDIAPRNMSVHGVLFGLEMHSETAHAMIERYFAQAADGRLIMPIAAEFPLSQASEAHRHAEQAKPFGRVLIIP
jgi:NADPH2:quinone reductase